MKTLLAFFVFLTGTLLATPAFAAVFSLSSDVNDLYVGDQFEISVYLDTKNENINAVEGEIVYPTDQLKLLDTKTGNSIINFWLTRPTVSTSPISFSGITPGGFVANTGYLFSMIFEAKKGGIFTMSFINATALKNDGRGTETKASAASLPLKITSLARPDNPRLHIPSPDIQPPEIFTAQISRDPAIFSNKFFVYFDTQDKNSGIDHFEVLEKKYYNFAGFTYQTGRWKTAESPYLLRDQSLRSEIEIKAVDRAGNQRIAILPPTNHRTWYQNIIFWCIILLTVIPIVIWKIIPKV